MNVRLIYHKGTELVAIVESDESMPHGEVVDRWLARNGLTTKTRTDYRVTWSPVISLESLKRFEPIQSDTE